MKKKLTLILSTMLVVISCCAALIGCTPSKPDAYMTKWIESENKSIISVETRDYVIKYVDKVKDENNKYVYIHNNGAPLKDENGEIKEYPGKTTIERTYIKNGDNYLVKEVQITKLEDEKTEDIQPTVAYIFEKTKEGKYNVYYYHIEWKADDEKEIYGYQGKWTAKIIEETELNDNIAYQKILEVFDDRTKEFEATAQGFADKYTKSKGKYSLTENGSTYTYSIKTGELLYTETIGEDIEESLRFDLNEKFTISSGAKEALAEFKETFEGKLVRTEDVKGKAVYYISVDGKEYKVNEKVEGYEKLETAKADDIVKVRLHKGFFGGLSITKVF